MNKKILLIGLVQMGCVAMPCLASEYFTQYVSPFDLDGYSLTFTPNGSEDYYSASAVLITALPVDPSTHSRVTLSDDNSRQRRFSDEKFITFYGVNQYAMNIGSNGYITFNEHDVTYAQSISNHFSEARISTFFADLNPAAGGRVSWFQLDDRAVVTFESVPRFGTSLYCTFQTELFFDGRIRMSWLDINYSNAIIGLSAGGGVPGDFFYSDLSEFAWDIDEDGMANTWELKYFGNITNCIATADADGDGYDNMAEYICGSHPKNASSVFSVTAQPGSAGAEAILVGWDALEGRKYRVLRNNNLSSGTFEPLVEGVLYPQNTYTGLVESVQNPYFYKVEVEMAE